MYTDHHEETCRFGAPPASSVWRVQRESFFPCGWECIILWDAGYFACRSKGILFSCFVCIDGGVMQGVFEHGELQGGLGVVFGIDVQVVDYGLQAVHTIRVAVAVLTIRVGEMDV